MDLIEQFEAYKSSLAPDKRVTLCDVQIQGGALSGAADKTLESALYRFAAEHRLGSKVQFLEPGRQKIQKARAALRKTPEADAEMVSEACYGETVKVYDRRGDFYRVATQRDDYLGWVHLTELTHALPTPTHRVAALRGHIFAGPKVSAPRLLELSYGVSLCVEDLGESWCKVAFGKGQAGYVKTDVLLPLDAPPADATAGSILAFARGFLQAPYVWGGATAWGLDCSGLVQSVFGAHGIALPRDADQQELSGEEVSSNNAAPADLLFFPGHVAISMGGTRFIHANGKFMRVTINDFDEGDYGRYLREQLRRVARVPGVQHD